MKHLGSVTDINGAEIEKVDVITFGSPCQDLSIAGRREGLSGERSGLFSEAVRIIKEMRDDSRRTTNDIRCIQPRYAIWENVYGAFSSNKGEDFRCVLEQLARIEGGAELSIPMPKQGKWAKSGEIIGNGWSIAWRGMDAQFWGVPQRRKRIALVVDFGSECVGEILFERKSLSRNSEQSSEERKRIATCLKDGIGMADKPCTLQIRSGCEGGGKGALIQVDKSATLSTINNQTLFIPCTVDYKMGNTYVWEDQANTLAARDYKQPQTVVYPLVVDQGGAKVR